MHRTIHTATRTLAAALLAAAVVAAPALAQARRAARTASKADAVENVEARIKALHAQLRITPEQEPTWNDVAQVMRDNAARIKELRRTQIQNTSSMTAVDELNTYASVVDAHADGLHKLAPAFQRLYDSMSPEQKKNADAVFRARARAAVERHKP